MDSYFYLGVRTIIAECDAIDVKIIYWLIQIWIKSILLKNIEYVFAFYYDHYLVCINIVIYSLKPFMRNFIISNDNLMYLCQIYGVDYCNCPTSIPQIIKDLIYIKLTLLLVE
jgi:hypothetical protein